VWERDGERKRVLEDACSRLTVAHEWCEDPELAAGAEDQARGQQVGVAEKPGEKNLVLGTQPGNTGVT
jgi:predicted transcriptional regulator